MFNIDQFKKIAKVVSNEMGFQHTVSTTKLAAMALQKMVPAMRMSVPEWENWWVAEGSKEFNNFIKDIAAHCVIDQKLCLEYCRRLHATRRRQCAQPSLYFWENIWTHVRTVLNEEAQKKYLEHKDVDAIFCFVGETIYNYRQAIDGLILSAQGSNELLTQMINNVNDEAVDRFKVSTASELGDIRYLIRMLLGIFVESTIAIAEGLPKTNQGIGVYAPYLYAMDCDHHETDIKVMVKLYSMGLTLTSVHTATDTKQG